MTEYIEGLEKILKRGTKEVVGMENPNGNRTNFPRFRSIYLPLSDRERFDIQCEVNKWRRQEARR